MTIRLSSANRWAAVPDATADVATRLGWYAAVAGWAPSKHNTQPWRFLLHDETLEFWTDPTRMLPETDPHRREMVISCGAAIHLACVAARALGHQPRVAVSADATGEFLAQLEEAGTWGTTEDDRRLLDAIPLRRTDRGPLDREQLPPALPFQLQSAAAAEGASLRLVSTAGDRSSLAALVERADRLLVQRGQVDAELARWLREPGDSRQDGVPSDHTRGPGASYRAEFVQRDFSSTRSRPAQDRPGPDDPVIGILCTPADQQPDWLAAGRALAAVLLRATAAGANASYLNQPVEESAMRHQLREQFALDGVPQLVLRIGVGGEVLPTPRRHPGSTIARV